MFSWLVSFQDCIDCISETSFSLYISISASKQNSQARKQVSQNYKNLHHLSIPEVLLSSQLTRIRVELVVPETNDM